jgi:hypothetical protein
VRDRLLRDLQTDARNQYWLVDVDQRIVADGPTAQIMADEALLAAHGLEA